MDRTQWNSPNHASSRSPQPANTGSMVDSPMCHKWHYGVDNRLDRTNPEPWAEFYPLPISSDSISTTQSPSGSSRTKPTFSANYSVNEMQTGLATFPYLMHNQANSPSMTHHNSPFMEPLQESTTQPGYSTMQGHRDSIGFDFDQPNSSYHATHNSHTYQSSATSASGHGSEEEGESSKGLEERLLLQLKDEQNQSWKKIAEAFKSQCGKDYSVPALQMRYRRLRQRRLLDFNDADQAALMAAYDYWETKRWEIISEKMAEFGATDSWTPKACSAAWLRFKGREDTSSTRSLSTDQGMDMWRPMDVQESLRGP